MRGVLFSMYCGSTYCVPLLSIVTMPVLQLMVRLRRFNHGVPTITSYPANGMIANSTLSIRPPKLITHSTYIVTVCWRSSAKHTVLLLAYDLLPNLCLLTNA